VELANNLLKENICLHIFSGLESGECNVDGVIICIDSSEEHFFF
jgi:hypothetical protein